MSVGLLVVGSGDLFHTAAAQFARQQPARRIEKLEITWTEAQDLDTAFLDPYAAEEWSVFAATGMEGMNFVRLGLFSLGKQRGFGGESFIHSSAVVDPSASIGQNCYVGENAVIGPKSRLDYNVVIGARSVLGSGARLGSSAWIGANGILGAGSRVGSHTVIGAGVMVAQGITIGRFCELQIARNYTCDVPDMTFHHELFDQPVRIYA
ncbi:MAG: DapH/DapD/GlmU-related protein [Burkholderiales bacterium]